MMYIMCNTAQYVLYTVSIVGNFQCMNIEFEWNPSLSVNDETLDNQHKQLLKQVNKLIKSVLDASPKTETIKEAFTFLDAYIEYHFQEEEYYMKKHEYPDIVAHIALHDGFSKRYKELKAKIVTQNFEELNPIDLEIQLARWWVDHIGNADKQYAEYIRVHTK